MATILADHRENNGAIPYLSACVDANNRDAKDNEINYDIINNGVYGDYTIIVNGIITAVFERKTWKDLAASIKDQRSELQHKSLLGFREKYGCDVYYIIEGPMSYKPKHMINRIPFKNLHAKIRKNTIRDNIPHFQTANSEKTAELLCNLARDYLTIKKTYYQQQPEFLPEYLLQEIEKLKTHVNDEISDILENACEKIKALEPESENTVGGFMEKLKEKPKRENSDIYYNMWCSIPGISIKSAPVLMNNFHIRDLLNNEISQEEISNSKFPSGTKIGDKRAQQILNFIASDKVGKILAQIPGISLATANLILENYSLKELCAGIDISDLKKPTGRRIGPKVSERIENLLSDK